MTVKRVARIGNITGLTSLMQSGEYGKYLSCCVFRRGGVPGLVCYRNVSRRACLLQSQPVDPGLHRIRGMPVTREWTHLRAMSMDDADNQAGDEERHGGYQWVRQPPAGGSARFPNGAV